jgi:hypothetical protein
MQRDPQSMDGRGGVAGVCPASAHVDPSPGKEGERQLIARE